MMKVTPVAAPLRFQVASVFRTALISGRFKPGDRLVEKDLCDLTGASRTTVREALRQLETEGLVDMVANRGPVVAVISAEQAQDIYEVREALEALAGSLFCQRATRTQRDALVGAVKAIGEAYKSGNIEESLASKDSFYDVLLDGAGNEIISSTLRQMHARVSLLRKVSLGHPNRLSASLKEIQAIAKAVKAGDAEATAEACRIHIRSAGASALGSLSS